MEDRRLSSRADNIAMKLKSEHPITSKLWKTWTEKTNEYNSTSLTQVFGEYFREHSVGDNGGINIKDSDYMPKAGYPGTLAPGEKFTQDCSIENLPKKILHPWPAMQEIQFHIRSPPSHPMIPSALLWFALNNMFTENFTEWQLSLPSEEVVGGWMMEPKDAIRIARSANFGMSYEQSEQIAHGGLLFPGGLGGSIPFYNPDHGPTVSDELATPPIPPELKSITERWLDPYFGLDAEANEEDLSSEEEVEVKEEEEIRKQAVKKLFNDYEAFNGMVSENEDVSLTVKVEESFIPQISRRLADSTAVYYDKLRKLIPADIEKLPNAEEDEIAEEAFKVAELEKRGISIQNTLLELEKASIDRFTFLIISPHFILNTSNYLNHD